MIKKFSFNTAELGNYVYVYSDPDDHKPFYIGRGKGNRVFNHLTYDYPPKNKDPKENKKIEKLEELRKNKKDPVIEILIHGMDLETAKAVETAAIDLIGVNNLTNQKRGDKAEFGIMDVTALNAKYKKDELEENEITDNVMMININKLYSSNMTAFELYEATRGYWRVGKTNSDKVKYVLSVYSGMVLEVYEVAGWYGEMSTMMDSRATETAFLYEEDYDEEEMKFDRREFVGRVALDEIRNKYIYKSVASFYANGKRNPIRYFLNGTDEEE